MEPSLFEKLINLNAENPHVDVMIIAMYVMVGYYLRHNFTESWKWPPELKILLVGSLVVSVYIGALFAAGASSMEAWPKLVLSYTVAFTLNGYILKRFERKKEEEDNSITRSNEKR